MNWNTTAVGLVIALTAFAVMLAMIRLWRGPTAADRVVVLDTMGSFAIGIVTIESIALDNSIFIDAAMIIALVAFLGTVAFAYYIRRQV